MVPHLVELPRLLDGPGLGLLLVQERRVPTRRVDALLDLLVLALHDLRVRVCYHLNRESNVYQAAG